MSREHDTLDVITPRLDDLGTRLDRIDSHLDSIGDKLDDHLQRVTKAESDIGWLRGYARISTTVFLAVIGALGAVLLNMLFPGSK